MSKASVSYADIKADLLKDPEVKAEYDALEPRYQAIRQIIQARNELHITQAELAKRIGTSKSTWEKSGSTITVTQHLRNY